MSIRHIAVLGALSLTLSSACAKSGKTEKAADPEGTEVSLKMTGVDSFDDVFTAAAEIDTSLDTARENLKTGRTNLATALDLPQGTPLEDSLAELKERAEGKLQVATKNGNLAITADDAMPSNAQAGLDALNAMLDGYASSAKELATLPEKIEKVTIRSNALAQKLQDPGSLGLSATEIPGVTKKTKHNAEMIANMPNRVTKLTGEIQSNTRLVSKTFGN